MKRVDILKRIAMMPVVGMLLSSEVGRLGEDGAISENAAEEYTVFARLTSSGTYFNMRVPGGWPTLLEIKDAALEGFDRFEVWIGGRVVYQDTTWPGRIPAGWDSLEHAGFLR